MDISALVIVVSIIALYFWLKRQPDREEAMAEEGGEALMLLWAALLPAAVILGFWMIR
jgi:hypothetical protein